MDAAILPAAPILTAAPILPAAPILKKVEKKAFISVSEVVKQTLKKKNVKLPLQ